MSWAIWLTGLPGSGKSVLARTAAAELRALGQPVEVLELDRIRKVLTPLARYTEDERNLVYRALVFMAKLLVDAGVPVIIDATAHRRRWRERARNAIPRFAEVRLDCPLEICRERERTRTGSEAPRDIYAGAGRPGSTVPGVDVEYEASLTVELVLDTSKEDVQTATGKIVALGRELARLCPAVPPAPPAWAVWITGLSGSGKTTIARAATEALQARGIPVKRLESSAVFAALAPGGATPAHDLVYRALCYAAKLLTGIGIPIIIDATGARRRWRELARELIGDFAEVQLICPPEICALRARAARWKFTGRIPDETESAEPALAALGYERSLSADLTLYTDVQDRSSAVEHVVVLAQRLHHTTLDRRSARRAENTMRVRELMTRGLITVNPETPVFEARALMMKERIRHLIVVEGDRLAGIITDRDIRLNLPSPATSLSVWELNYLLARLTVGQVMTKAVITVDPDRDARSAARMMLDHGIGALPVLDGTRPIGIVTETDLLRAYAKSADVPEEAAARA